MKPVEAATRPYDPRDRASIFKYASRLTGETLRSALAKLGLSGLIVQRGRAKGYLGQDVEKLYYGLKNSSDSEPDFRAAGIELKTTGLLKTSKGWRAKERMVLSIINYMTVAGEKSFAASSFWRKNADLLIHFYLYEAAKNHLDYRFLLDKEWTFPANDRKIIQGDWEQILGKIRAGKAHELSERDTLYLGACTKGATSETRREQPHGPMAKQRAFSLKQGYVNHIADVCLAEAAGPIFKSPSDLSAATPVERQIIERFEPHYGKTQEQLKKRFRIVSDAKHLSYLLAKAILQVKKERIEEFEKGDVQIKTIVLENSGRLKESMSFRNIDFVGIGDESWGDSRFYEDLNKRFLFVVFRRNQKGEPVLERVMFWAIPHGDLEKVRGVWRDTRATVARGDFEHFVRISDQRISHVRPKGRDSSDLTPTPQGKMVGKKCFWLNSDYIRAQIQ